MSSEVVYIMQKTDDEWVQPTPAHVAIGEAIVGATDVEETDLDGIADALDSAKLRRVLDAEEPDELTVAVAGHDVTIHSSGAIDVR